MRRFKQIKAGDKVVISGKEVTVTETIQDTRGFKVIGFTKDNEKLMRYDENPNATI